MRAVWNAVFPKNILPIQLGYSSCGKVIEIGENVKSFHVGDMVVSNGNHAEYVVVNQNLCSRIPENTNEKDELKQKTLTFFFELLVARSMLSPLRIIISVDNNNVIKQFWHVLQCF